MPDILSPDCRDGKCAACTGDAWNDTTDQGCACECAWRAALRAASAVTEQEQN